MSKRNEEIEAMLDALAPAGQLRAKAMFGGYGIYLNDKVVAFVVDGVLFVKITPGAEAAMPDAPKGPAYPGSKDYLRVEGPADDPDPVIAALRAVAKEAPEPKPKKRKT